jgi:methionine sulfoxide reductase heme-binding subunit
VSHRLRVALKTLTWAACLWPLAALARRALEDELGANPIDHVTRSLGETALVLLLASLAMTPIRIVAGVAWPARLRRLLGLFAFFYASLHFSVWIVLDHFFAWRRLWSDVLERPYITVGVLTLATLLLLAATSTKGMIRRLGPARWQLLHRLAYVAAGLAVVHFLWQAKVGVRDPYVYGAVLALLLGIRLWDWARRRAGRLSSLAEAALGRGPEAGPNAR